MPPAVSVVLLGEPDQATGELYRSALGAVFDVILASDEDTVLHMLRTHHVATLVLEPMIFATHPWERLAEMSRLCIESGISLVICSTLDQRRHGMELDVAAYLVKPTLPDTLVDTLLKVVEDGRS